MSFTRTFSRFTSSANVLYTPSKRVVVLGSGWGGFNLATSFPVSSPSSYLNVISPSNHFTFTPLIPSTAVGTLEFRAIQEPVRTVPSVSQYYQAKCHNIDFEAQTVTCRGLWDDEVFTIAYDKLVLAQGVKTNTFNTPNVATREGKEVFFLKNLHHARGIRNRTIEMFEVAALPDTSDEERQRLLSFIIVGGGPTSVEYASELHDFLSEDLIKLYPDLSKYVKITLVEAGPALLGPFEATLREYVGRLFTSRNIDVKVGTAVTAVESFTKQGYKNKVTKAVLSDGEELEFGTMVWSAGLAPVVLTDQLGVEKNQQGRILTDKYLRVKGQEGEEEGGSEGQKAGAKRQQHITHHYI